MLSVSSKSKPSLQVYCTETCSVSFYQMADTHFTLYNDSVKDEYYGFLNRTAANVL